MRTHHRLPLPAFAHVALLVLLALVVLVSSACDEEDDASDSGATATTTQAASPSPTATPADAGTASPTTTPTPTAGGVPQAVTGIAEVDLLIQAVAEADVDALVERTHTQAVPCTTEQGAGGPPQCQEGDEQSTPYTVFPVIGCEGGWTDDPETLWTRFVQEAGSLYAATEAGFEANEWPQPDVYLIFPRTITGGAGGEGAARLHVSEDGAILAYWEGCQAPLEELMQYDNQELEVIAGPFAEDVE
ncbi:MAG: hypothetical protein M0R73_07965 [Dehalococcoidia bacterium]|nr:hypothetical protein [Dehalococcoidia bacterium]